MALDSVKILYKGGTAEIEVKKSRFIANLKPVESEEEAAAFIAEIKKEILGRPPQLPGLYHRHEPRAHKMQR